MKLDMHCEMILDDYREKLPLFEKIRSVALERIEQCLNENKIVVASINSRIKTEESLTGKLELKKVTTRMPTMSVISSNVRYL